MDDKDIVVLHEEFCADPDDTDRGSYSRRTIAIFNDKEQLISIGYQHRWGEAPWYDEMDSGTTLTYQELKDLVAAYIQRPSFS